jgi:serine/threonine protein kinase
MRSLIIVLTIFMKQVLKLGGSKDEVDFSNEELCLCYSDITVDNFLITKAGQIYVIDFGEAAFLPRSFMSFVLHGRRKYLSQRISDKMSLPKSANHGAMGLASYFFQISSDSRIGKSASVAV